MVTQKLKIRLDESELPEVRMVSGDVGREIQIEVYAREDSENPIDLENYSAEITIIKPDNTFIMDNFSVDKYELPENAGAVSGKGYYQIKIYTAGTHQIYTGQGPFLVDDMILSDDVIESSSIAFGDRFPEDFATKTWVDEEIEHAGIGTYVKGNPAGDPTESDLLKLQINDKIYPIPVPSVPESLDDLDDVEITSPTDGQALLYDDDDDVWKNQNLPDVSVTKTATGNPIEITDGAAAPLVKCVTQITGYQSGSGTPSPDNVRPIVAYSSGTVEVEDEGGSSITHAATFPMSIYRGSADYVGGNLISEKVILVLNTADMNDSELYPGWSGSGIRALLGGGLNTILSNQILNIGTTYAINTLGLTGDTLFLPYSVYGKTAAEWKALAIDVQIVVELPTPTTAPITISNYPIKSLSGYSHIESTTGEMEVEYITQQFEPLLPCHFYSTAEHVVGKWVDGSDVKEKTYIYTGTGAANPFTATIDMTGKSIIEVIPHYAKYTYGGGTVGYCAGSKLTESNSAVLKVEYDDATPPTVNVTSYLGSSTETYEIAFTIRYI